MQKEDPTALKTGRDCSARQGAWVFQAPAALSVSTPGMWDAHSIATPRFVHGTVGMPTPFTEGMT